MPGCLKKNHFARACRSDKVSAVNQVDDSSDEEDSDDEYVKKVTIGWMSTDTGKFLFIFMTQTQEWVCSSNCEPECLMPSERRYKAQIRY